MNKLSLSVLMIIGVSCYEAKGMEWGREASAKMIKVFEEIEENEIFEKVENGFRYYLKNKKSFETPRAFETVVPTTFECELEVLKRFPKAISQIKEEVSDDVISPTQWIKDASTEPYKEVFEGHTNYWRDENPRVRQRFMYDTPQTGSQFPIIYLITHGTWARKTRAFFEHDKRATDQGDQKCDNYFRDIKKQAAKHAIRKAKKLEFLSFIWSGANEDDDRNDAARGIVKLLTYLRMKYGSIETVLLGHSHGANVNNLVTHWLDDGQNPIDLLIHFSCPIRPEYAPNEKNYKKLMYFFSKADGIARAGRKDHTLTRFAIYASSLGTGVATGITTAASIVFPPLAPIPVALGAYTIGAAHALNPIFYELENDLYEYSYKPNSFGFNTIIDGRVPAHSSKITIKDAHSEILDVVPCLDIVYDETLEDCYKNKNNLFNLDAHPKPDFFNIFFGNRSPVSIDLELTESERIK